tara:strand:+ start:281 stop:484 length:204 start_codon:yes stop_codon:yes gene_type:complete
MNIPLHDKQMNDLIEAAKTAVIGYEMYLKDEINYNDLAKIMKILRDCLPDQGSGLTGEFMETTNAAI